jgi:hypothetical protein
MLRGTAELPASAELDRYADAGVRMSSPPTAGTVLAVAGLAE